jgi:Ca2+/H+ antiporter
MPSAQWLLDSLIGVLIAAPLLAVGFSLVLTVWSRFAKDGERWPMAAGNALMLILWLMSLIAPN